MAEIGRPSIYTQEISDEICSRLAAGESLRAIAKSEHLPSLTTIFRWLTGTDEAYTKFRDQYARARRIQAEHLVDEILEISDDGTNDWMERKSEAEKGQGIMTGWVLNGEHVQRSRLRVDTRKWFAGKVAPRTYGEKSSIALGQDPDLEPIGVKVVERPPITREEWLKLHSKPEGGT